MGLQSAETAERGPQAQEHGAAAASLQELLRSGLVQVGVDGLGTSSGGKQPGGQERRQVGAQIKAERTSGNKTRRRPGSGKIGRGAQDQADSAVHELPFEQQVDMAREVALKSLTVCARTRQQLAQTLGRKGFAVAPVEAVLDRLTEVGLIDDAAYAETLVRVRCQERGLARKAIAAELARKGIDRSTAKAALGQLSEEDERATALVVARARARATTNLDYPVRLRRIVAHLGRKGYNSEIALSAARAALAQE